MRSDARQREIQYYRTSNGRQPFIEWSESIRDQSTQNRIDKRLERLEDGNFGDCQSVGDGVLNCVSTSGRDIVSISAKLTMRLFFCFVVETRPHKRGILNAQKPIGENIRRHSHERNGKLA